MDKRRMGMMAVLLCFCLCLIPLQAGAVSTADGEALISTEQDCSLSISYCSGGVAFSELPIRLYKIADVSADSRYILTSPFAGSNLNLNGIQTAGEWDIIRSTLEPYILANGVAADCNAATDTEGKASFAALKPGLYLAITDHAVWAKTTYVFDSALIALPGLGTDGRWQYQVAVTAKGEMIPPIEGDDVTERRVLKLWKGDSGSKTRPTAVEVEIFRNGESYERVTLSEENQWTYTWPVKDDGAEWKVVERNVPTGYTMTVEERELAFVITNTLNNDRPDDPDVPKTGDTTNVMLWFVLMAVSGSLLLILGLTGKRSRL